MLAKEGQHFQFIFIEHAQLEAMHVVEKLNRRRNAERQGQGDSAHLESTAPSPAEQDEEFADEQPGHVFALHEEPDRVIVLCLERCAPQSKRKAQRDNCTEEDEKSQEPAQGLGAPGDSQGPTHQRQSQNPRSQTADQERRQGDQQQGRHPGCRDMSCRQQFADVCGPGVTGQAQDGQQVWNVRGGIEDKALRGAALVCLPQHHQQWEEQQARHREHLEETQIAKASAVHGCGQEQRHDDVESNEGFEFHGNRQDKRRKRNPDCTPVLKKLLQAEKPAEQQSQGGQHGINRIQRVRGRHHEIFSRPASCPAGPR